MSTDVRRVTLVTGGSSGIGLAAARAFWERGDIVYALSRTPPPEAGFRFIQTDVTSDDSVSAAIEKVYADCGRLDVLVLSAGFGVSGAVEFTDSSDAISQLDVCFFGAFRAAKAAIPVMRQKGGAIVFVSSVAACIPIPFQAFYSSAKAALNALVLALRNELRPYPVRVCAVLPGDVKTGFTAARKKDGRGAGVYPALEKSVATMERDEQKGMPPEKIAKKIVALSEQRNPKPFSTVGGSYKLFLLLAKLLPARLLNFLVSKIYG